MNHSLEDVKFARVKTRISEEDEFKVNYVMEIDNILLSRKYKFSFEDKLGGFYLLKDCEHLGGDGSEWEFLDKDSNVIDAEELYKNCI